MSELILHELKWLLRQPFSCAAAIFMLVLGLVITGSGWLEFTDPNGRPIALGGPYLIGTALASTALVTLLNQAVLIQIGHEKDVLSNYRTLCLSTPARRFDMHFSKSVASTLAGVLLCSCLIVGLCFGLFSSAISDAHSGTSRLSVWAVLWLSFCMLTPLAFSGVVGLSQTIFGLRSGAWVAVILIFGLNSISTLMPSGAAALVDPIGFEAMGRVTHDWTPALKNNANHADLAKIIMNRLVWAGIGLMSLLLAARIHTPKGRLFARKKKAARTAFRKRLKSAREVPGAITRGSQPSSFGVWQGLWRSLTIFKSYFRSPIVWALIIASLGLIVIQMVFGQEGSQYQQRLNGPLAADIIVRTLRPLLLLFAIIPIADQVWRDRMSGSDAILNASPASNATLIGSIWFASLLAILSSIVLASLGSLFVFLMLADGAAYLEETTTIILIGLVPYAVLATLISLFIQSTVPNKALGIGMAVLIAGIAMEVLHRLPGTPPLFGFGRISAGPWSPANGFLDAPIMASAVIGLFGLFLGIALIGFGFALWDRRAEPAWPARRELTKALSTSRGRMGIIGLGLAALLFAAVQLHLAETGMEPRSDRQARLAVFERDTEIASTLVTPTLQSIKLVADVYPEQDTAEFRTEFIVGNDTSDPITEWVISPPLSPSVTWSLEEENSGVDPVSTPLAVSLESENYRLIAFSPPLQPGENRQISVTSRIPPSKLFRQSPVLEMGVFLTSEDVLPRIGFHPRRLTRPDQREAAGLPPLPQAKQRNDAEALTRNFLQTSRKRVDLHIKLCSAASHRVFASGYRLSEVTEYDRHCATFFAPQAGNYFAVLSGRLGKSSKLNSAKVRVFGHMDHPQENIDAMAETALIAEELLSELFGPPPIDQIDIVAVPYQRHAQSHLSVIAFGERAGFTTRATEVGLGEEVKMPNSLATVAHEVAHQWFGHKLLPADTEGAEVLTESLADFYAGEILAVQFDRKTALSMRDRRVADYLSSRQERTRFDPPLARAVNQDQLIIGRGHGALFALTQRYGREHVDTAVKSLLTGFADQDDFYPTTLDLIAALEEALPPEAHTYVSELFETDNIRNVAFSPSDEEGLPCPMDIEVRLMRDKEEDSWPISSVEASIFPSEDDYLAGSRRAKSRTLLFENGRATFKVSEPSYIVLDPDRHLIERDMSDNRLAVCVGGTALSR